jgi:hypothetical protein
MSAQLNGYPTAGGVGVASGFEDDDGVVGIRATGHGGGGTVTV